MNERHEGLGSRAMRRAFAAVLLALFGATLSAACGSGSTGSGGHSGGSTGGPSAGASGVAGSARGGESGSPAGVVGQGAASGELLPDCAPVYASCDGLCGPVTDPCTGKQ